MERKVPYATQEEYDKHVIHLRDVPTISLPLQGTGHVESRIVSVGKMTVSFFRNEPGSILPVTHHHENEQIMIVTEGAAELEIDGKMHHIEKGDVLIYPPNMEHGAGTVSDLGLVGIDIFTPPRQDLVAKLEEAKKSQKS